MIAEVMKMREEENKRSSQGSSVKRFFKKRWVFPAIYIASAAIILTGVLWFQSSNSTKDKFDYEATDVTDKKNETPAIEVNAALENIKMPVEKPMDAVVKMEFYDFNASDEEQQAALVFFNNQYVPNTGVDLAAKDGETFAVVASISGTVTRVEEDATLGNVIEIEHDKGIVTQYSSVKDVKVEVGDKVKQGQELAMAGQSLFNEEAGTHVHFEIRKDGVAVNPTSYFNKSVSALQEATPADETNGSNANDKQMIDDPDLSDEDDSKEEEKTPSEKKKPAEGETPSEDESPESTDTTNS
jgi:stage II sporulation protein Q